MGESEGGMSVRKIYDEVVGHLDEMNGFIEEGGEGRNVFLFIEGQD